MHRLKRTRTIPFDTPCTRSHALSCTHANEFPQRTTKRRTKGLDVQSAGYIYRFVFNTDDARTIRAKLNCTVHNTDRPAINPTFTFTITLTGKVNISRATGKKSDTDTF